MRTINEGLELGFSAESRINGGEVDAPIPVICRTVALHGALHDEWGDPDAREPEVGESLQAAFRVGAATGQALQVTSVKEPNVGRVEPRHRTWAREKAAVIRRVSVGIAIGHHEVNDSRPKVGVHDWRRE